MFKVVVTVIGRPMKKVSANIQLRYFLRAWTGIANLLKARKSNRNMPSSLGRNEHENYLNARCCNPGGVQVRLCFASLGSISDMEILAKHTVRVALRDFKHPLHAFAGPLSVKDRPCRMRGQASLPHPNL